MKTLISSLKVVMALLIVGGGSSIFDTQAQTTYAYAVMSIAPLGDSATIHIVDPESSSNPVETREFPLPTDWLLIPQIHSQISPDGRWMVSTLFARDQSRLMIQVTNVETLQSEAVIEGYMLGETRHLAWSPDSRTLAIVLRATSELDSDLYVYRMDDSTLINISNDDFDQRDAVWSQDNDFVLAFTHPCAANTVCADQLTLFDVASGRAITTANLSALPFLGSSACNPNSTSNIVAFTSNCGVGIPFATDFPNEVYLWDTSTGTVRQITNYTSQAEPVIASASYHYEWLSSTDLLIGVNYQVSGQSEQQELIEHNIETGMSIVRTRNLGQGFALDSTRTLLAIQSSREMLTATNAGQSSEVAIVRIDEIRSISPDTLGANAESRLTLPSTCDLFWSPDSNGLAVSSSSVNCSFNVETLTFLNQSSNGITNFDISSLIEIRPNHFVVNLGWVRTT
jgi:Tol biopolymer transport system component